VHEKSKIKEEDCPENYWRSIYVPNSSQTKNGIK
jgi:hypothetical protein